MEVYAELKTNMGVFTVVTYAGGRRVERRIYVEEKEGGHVDLVVRGEDGLPKRLEDEVFW